MDETLPSDLNEYVNYFLETEDESPVEMSTTISEVEMPLKNAVKRELLTTRNAVKYLLEGTLKSKVCRYCMNVVSQLSELDKILQMANMGSLYEITIKDMVASFHPFKVEDDPNFPDKICEKCLDRTISSYLFTQQCEQAERALRNCFEDMYEKLDKLDPLERTKKRGRQKLKPNYNVLHTEHNYVINYADPLIHIVNLGSKSLTEQTPISELECLKCSEVLPNIQALMNHTKIHPKSMWYNCRLCGTSFFKYNQLKKHFRLKHTKKQPNIYLDTKKQVTNFVCNECGVETENHNEHLQHIEKHKFKTVMEHLIDGEMDKLCSICLNKGSGMTPLSKMICLHGGCPELTGDRPLGHILASTLPEKKNKYQELLVPTQASIIHVKRKKNASHNNTDFPLSSPTIVNVENLNCDDLYLFFFSEPKRSNSAKIIEIDNTETPVDVDHIQDSSENDKEVDLTTSTSPIKQMPINIETIEIDENYPLSDKIDIQMDTPKTEDEYVNYTFNFSDEDEKYETIEIENEKPRESKDNWIFKKTSIKHNDDAKSVDILDENNVTATNIKLCNYCWVFKHLDKCDYCNKINKPLNINEGVNISKANFDVTTKKIQEEHNLKKIADKNSEKDKKTWQCNICLTNNNYDRKMCDCCELNPQLKFESSTFKFHKSSSYNVDLNRNVVLETETTALMQNIPLDVKVEDVSNLCIDTVAYDNNQEYNVPEPVSPMETEVIEIKDNFNLEVSFNNCEAMDTEDIPIVAIPEEISIDDRNNETNMANIDFNKIDNMAVVEINDTPANNNAFATNQFQFAIGSGEKGTRKRKSLRNMNRAFHK